MTLIDDKAGGFFNLWKSLNGFLLLFLDGKKPDISAVTNAAETIIDSLTSGDELITALFVENQPDDIASHLIDVAIVAAKLGLRLGYAGSQIKELAIAALLHDVGMLRLPENILSKKERLSETELKEIRKHPIYSSEMLREIDGIPPIVPDIAYQEQEREDGSGYPRRLKGEEIHEYAKIIGLADIYTAMLQPRPQRGRKLPFEIVKEIIEKNKKQFPEYLIRCLLDELSVFPVGLYVKLNTGEIGRVLRTSRLAPLRPVVEIIRDAHGRNLSEHKEYDLMKENIFRIVDTFFTI